MTPTDGTPVETERPWWDLKYDKLKNSDFDLRDAIIMSGF